MSAITFYKKRYKSTDEYVTNATNHIDEQINHMLCHAKAMYR